MQRTDLPDALKSVSTSTLVLKKIKQPDCPPERELLQYRPLVLTALIEPLLLFLPPAKDNLSREAKAPAAFWALKLSVSCDHSLSVGIRYPLGHGLLSPLTPCQRLLFCGLRQSSGKLKFKIKFPFAG